MNNKLGIAKITIAIIFASLASSTFAASNISVMYGDKSVDKDDWSPIETQTEYGLGFEYQAHDIPVAIMLTYSVSKNSETTGGIKYKGETTEFGVGVRKYLPIPVYRSQVFFEGGLVRISAKVNSIITPFDHDSSNPGWWLGAGMDIMIIDQLSIGFLGRISKAKVTLNGFNGEAGGTHIGIFAAYHFDY